MNASNNSVVAYQVHLLHPTAATASNPPAHPQVGRACTTTFPLPTRAAVLAATTAALSLVAASAAEVAAEEVTLARLLVPLTHLLMHPQGPRMLEDLAPTTEVVVEEVTVVSIPMLAAAVVPRSTPCLVEFSENFHHNL
jgi:hypothetical protein